MFGSKANKIADLEKALADLRTHLDQANAHLAEVGALEHWQVRQQIDAMRAEMSQLQVARETERQRLQAQLTADRDEHHRKLTDIKQQIEGAKAELVPYTDELIFQQAGVFRYHHPLQNAEAYKARLLRVTSTMKQMIETKTAVEANYNFTFNGSGPQGRRMVNDWCKVMLRAYNAEAENCLRVMKAGSVDTAKKRLDRTGDAIARLGRMLDIRISSRYRSLRMEELELTADYLQKKQEEKEAERAERERLREETKAQAEYRREIEKLEKERRHLVNVQSALRNRGDGDGAAKIQADLDNLDASLEGLHNREANIRAGYVYVISNIGSFGSNMVKIGMTRRLNPTERVLELGDASVPFRYDTHIMFYSPDAVGLEAALHRALSSRRVNSVNMRREFFYATPAEVRELLKQNAGEILEYAIEPEAIEYRQSSVARAALDATNSPPPPLNASPFA